MDFYGGGMGGYGMGGMGGGMGGGASSMPMMSSSMAASVSLSAVAALAFYMMNKSGSSGGGVAGDEMPLLPETGGAGATTAAPVTANLDGAKLITVGGISMNVEGSSCGNGRVDFAESKNDKWIWSLKKAGDWNGIPYYTIESFYKNFASACQERFLTAPTGCKSPPYLATTEFGPRQFWLIAGDAVNGYQLRSLACARSRYENQYLMRSAQGDAKPMFSARSGSKFVIENEHTA